MCAGKSHTGVDAKYKNVVIIDEAVRSQHIW